MAPDGAPACVWSYTPANFVPCDLPMAVPLYVTSDMTIDTATTALAKQVLTQSDGTMFTVIHLSTFEIDPARNLTVNGTAVAFAVDGDVDISGAMTVAAGSNDATQCATAKGTNGSGSTGKKGGGGGGGGGAGAARGGDGGDGSGKGAGGNGLGGPPVTSTLTPLRGGCQGGNGGRYNGGGTSQVGG